MFGWIIIGILGTYMLFSILGLVMCDKNEDNENVEYPEFCIEEYQVGAYCEFVRKHRKTHGKDSFKYIFDGEKTTVICKECGELIDLPTAEGYCWVDYD